MRVTLSGCDIERLDVVVTVSARLGGWVDQPARAAARAGPAAAARS